jgi:CDP-paratose 2-epimerase
MVEEITGQKMQARYIDENRIGDHICYYSDLRKMKSHYPAWGITRDLSQIFGEIARGWTKRSREAAQ